MFFALISSPCFAIFRPILCLCTVIEIEMCLFRTQRHCRFPRAFRLERGINNRTEKENYMVPGVD